MSASSVLVRPAYQSVPEYTRTLGPEVADLARLADFPPDPEQELILDAVFGIDGSGKSVAFETCVICSRQNLKTGVKKMCAMGWLVLSGERLIVWSAHEFRTAQEAFRDLEELLSGSDVLRRQIAKITRADGDEAIIMRSGSRLIFKTRTKGGGRGLTGDKVILDEGFALRPMHMGALLPTLSARPDPQVVYGSSAGLAESDVLRSIRDRGRPSGDPRLAYFEWCAPPPAEACKAGESCRHALGTEGCGCDNPDYWQMSNPALGRRIKADYIAAERRALPPAEFARERMGWWDEPAEGMSPLNAEQWKACIDQDSTPRNPVVVAFDVAPDRSMAAIAVAGWRDDGLIHGELVEHQPGTAWVAARLDQITSAHPTCALILDPSGPAGAFEKELNARGFMTKPQRDTDRQLHLAGGREYAQACGALADDIAGGRFRHLGQKPLDAAAEGARVRPLADAWAWSRKQSTADITPLTAVTLARHGLMIYGNSAPPPVPFVLFG